MSGEIPEGQQWDDMQAATMRMAAGMPKEQREGVLETRNIPPATFAAFCAAEGIELQGDESDALRKLPLAERLRADIGTFRDQVGRRLRAGLNNLVTAGEWNTLAEVQGKSDSRLKTRAGVGDMAVEALNKVCELLGLYRDGETGKITEKKEDV